MKNIYKDILNAKVKGEKLLAVLLDPDKISLEQLPNLILKIKESPATHIFVGGSTVTNDILDDLIISLKQNLAIPIILFPGSSSQISIYADGILFLSLISGRNPDYLIEHQVKSAPFLKKSNLEIISTGYVLIDGGRESAVERVSQTKPIDRNDFDLALATTQAGEMLGNKLIYLEAGSGAELSVPLEMIQQVSENIEIPLIVGGGLRDWKNIEKAYDAGADLVVIGTAFENDQTFFENQTYEASENLISLNN